MTVAIIIAGGVGNRMHADIPKQFVEVEGRPVLFHTLEAFERHERVDAIELVCIRGWEDDIRRWQHEFGISKLRWIVAGGNSAQESIRNGVYALEGVCNPSDIAIVHDGIRPLVDPDVLEDVIDKATEYGAAVTSLPYNEQIFLVDDADPAVTRRYIPRETLRRVSTPQAYRFDLLDEAYHKAFETGIGIRGSAYANTMMVELGHVLHFAAGSDKNIKLTTPGDLEVFRAMLKAKSEATDKGIES